MSTSTDTITSLVQSEYKLRLLYGHRDGVRAAGDNYTIYAKMNGEVVQELTFQGSGCAISKASALLLTKNTDTAPSCRAVVLGRRSACR